jgi:hypothetical protein
MAQMQKRPHLNGAGVQFNASGVLFNQPATGV